MGNAVDILRAVIEIPALDMSYAAELILMDGTESAGKGTDSMAVQCSSGHTSASTNHCQLNQCR